jgi:uncharacterized protein YdbL (DUF1318 family)
MNYSGIFKKLSLLTVLLVLVGGMSHALAMTLEQAKSAGLIGEQRDGYIGLVQQNAPPEVRELVQEVNRQRRQRYEEIARENDIALSDVAQLAYARAVEATRSGHFVQDANGNWVRKP